MKDKHLFVVYIEHIDGIDEESMRICIGEEARDLYISELRKLHNFAIISWSEPVIKR
jgi:hypothetical protein